MGPRSAGLTGPRRALLVVVALSVALVMFALPFLVPRNGNPGRADAVVVLSGDHGERLARALELMGAAVAPTLVLDGEPDSQQAVDLCDGGQPFEVVCLRPDPDSTRHEARAARRLASERGWRRMVVVTTSHHAIRAGMLFRRCFRGAVEVVAPAPPYGWRMSARQVVYEWLGMGAALTTRRGC